ncbi:hypothetical protein QQ045_030236 [Rhodiola kirilowii]
MEKDDILNRIKQEGNNAIEDAVYTLVVSIVEHFTGRYSNNGITLCNEIKLNRQLKRQSFMKKSQLGNLCDQFAIDKPFSSIPRKPKKDYTLYQKRKRFSKKKIEEKEERKYARKENKWQNSKSMTCHRCGKKGHFANNYWVKQKINNLEEYDRIMEIISNILLSPESELTDSSSTSEDLKVLRNENLDTDSDSDCALCKQGQPCLKKYSKNEEALYKLQSQFQNLEINMLSFKKAMELLEDVKDPKLRLKILDKLNTQLDTTQGTSQPQEVHREIVNPRLYLMDEVYRQIRQKTEVEKSTSTHDLIIETNNLKKEIQDIKINNEHIDQRISRIEKRKEVMTSDQDIPSNQNLKINDDHFLSTLEMFITQKWLVRVTLLINNDYSKDFTALIDSGADLNVIQEGLIPTRKHIFSIPSEEGFDKYQILKNTFDEKARSCRIDSAYSKMGREEIDTLLQQGLIDPWKSSWSGITTSKRMRDMPSYANFATIKEISKPTGNILDIPSYAKITEMQTSGMDHNAYYSNKKEEIIFLPDYSKGSNSSPRTLLKDYNKTYPYGTYRNQNFYENILIKNGCYISHVAHKQPEGYTFSELIIKRVISLQE